MNVLDLFSGIGGFSLGLERAGMRTVAFCEIHPYCRAVLKKHWPNVPILEDVCTVGPQQIAAMEHIDVICGGFPCQDISVAGAAAGLAGKRSGLWREFARLIGEVRPQWVVIENVGALRSRGLDQVLSKLDALGYDAEWHCIPLKALGAPHERDRIYIVAYATGMRWHERQWSEAQGWGLLRPWELDRASPWASAENNDQIRSGFLRVADGIPGHVDALDALGNSVSPYVTEIIGRAIMRAAHS